jgi:hypothetical protein
MRSSIRILSPPRTSTHCFRPLCTHPPTRLFVRTSYHHGRSLHDDLCVAAEFPTHGSFCVRTTTSRHDRAARHGSVKYPTSCMSACACARGTGTPSARRPAAGVRVTAFFFFLHSLTHSRPPPNGYLGGGLESVEGRRFVRAPAGVELSAAVVGSVKPSDGAAAAAATVVHSPWRISSSTSSNREGCFHKQLPFQHSDRLLSTRLQTAVVCCSDELREDTSSSVVNGVVVSSPPAARFRFLVSRLAKCCAFVRDH